MRRAQESLQFILVLAFILLGFGLLIQLQNEASKAYAKQTTGLHAGENLNDLAEAARAVWREGKGSQREFQMRVPAKTSISVTGGTIVQTLPDASTLSINTGTPISGALPQNTGTYRVRMLNNGTAVVITYA